MKALIEIPNYEFDNDVKDKFQDYFNRVKQDIADGTLCGNYELETTDMFLASFERLQVFPDNATNGDMIKAMFPYIKIYEHEKTDICDAYIQIDIWDFSICVSKDWWNAPYEEKRGNEND